jgi:23S rRNA pseudouridine1911/1915/1917 synthase
MSTDRSGTYLSLDVPDTAAGNRLDRFLADPLGSRTRAQSLIDGGSVSVDGRLRPKRYELRGGERVVVREGGGGSEARRAGPGGGGARAWPGGGGDGDAAGTSLAIAYEDEFLVVVDKPAGVVVHPARGHHSGTLAQALAGRGAGGDEPWRAGIVHRLDRDTSGLLVVAKSDAFHRALKSLLSARGLRREYEALVEGHPESRAGMIDAPIGRHRRDRVLMSIDTDFPREARTHFELVRALPRASLLRVTLETGRTHQIRVHMAAIGHPVCGDPSYGTSGLYGLRRQFLHAARLAFEHPVTHEPVDVHSPLPEDLEAALAVAEE